MTRLTVPRSETAPHYLGHRERLRERFLKAGGGALADYELLELVLFRAISRRDVKPLAKALLARFGSFAEVVAARPERLKEIEGLSGAAIVELKIVAETAKRFAKVKLEKRPSMESFSAVLDYCRTAMAFLDREEFRILFLDKKNGLIADGVQSTGTVDHAPVYPREIMRRALELNATSFLCATTPRANLPRPRPISISPIRSLPWAGRSMSPPMTIWSSGAADLRVSKACS
jgi:DNA repair protein RadC